MKKIIMAMVALSAWLSLASVEEAKAQIVYCASNNHAYSECYVGRGYVRLLNQVSNAPCIQGQTWGYDSWSGKIWVNNGCRANFDVQFGGGGGGGGGGTDYLICESYNHAYNRCMARGYIYSAQLIQQYSGAGCFYGQSWGYDNTSVWVSNGCRAQFQVWY